MAQNSGERKVMVISRPVDYFEVGAFGICAFYGVIALSKYQELAATSIKMYPGAGGVIFLFLLIVGGATGLVSFAFKTITGPRVELAGLTLLVILCLAYSVWTPFSVGVRGIGLLLFMGILIGIPGIFTRRRLIRYINRLESIEGHSRLGEREGNARATDTHAMGHRVFRRWWRR